MIIEAENFDEDDEQLRCAKFPSRDLSEIYEKLQLNKEIKKMTYSSDG